AAGYHTARGGRAGGEEAAAWADKILFSALTEKQVLGSILASPEYYSRAQTVATGPTPDAKCVRSLFQDLLGRPGSASEVAFWSNLVPTSGPAAAIQGILGSLEARTF